MPRNAKIFDMVVPVGFWCSSPFLSTFSLANTPMGDEENALK
jgi:hypothetical protein